MKKLLILIILSVFALTAQAQTNEALDTINIRKELKLNDYAMFGVQYGAGLSQVTWNPRQKQDFVFIPYNIGVTFTKYGKMFGYMPYFGFQAGVFLTQEGYQFEYNEENKYTYKIEGAEKAIMDVVEVPVLAHLQRFPGQTGNVSPEVEFSFLDTDNRFDYGLKGGVGLGLVFDPFEIHLKAHYKHSFSSLYQPDYYNEYYYRFAYPSNIIISAGLHFHLSKRTGTTKADLKKEARRMVYGN